MSESSSDGSLKSVSSTSSLKTAHHVDREEPPSPVKEDQCVDEEEHIYDDPYSLLEDNVCVSVCVCWWVCLCGWWVW